MCIRDSFPPEWKTKHSQKEKILIMKFFIWNKKTNTPGIHIFLSFIGFSDVYKRQLDTRLPTGLSPPSRSSFTLWEDTAPVKLTGGHGPLAGFTAQG